MSAMANKYFNFILLALAALPLWAEAIDTSAPRACAPSASSDFLRRRPGHDSASSLEDRPLLADCDLTPAFTPPVSEQLPVAMPDRWRIVETIGVNEHWYDPYNQNTWKGDRPLHDDWFLAISGIADSVLEPRRVPTPVGAATSHRGGSLDVLGDTNQMLFSQNLLLELAYLKGDTTFRPPDFEFRFIPVLNFTDVRVAEDGVLNVDPDHGNTRRDQHLGVQGLFADVHLRNVSVRYDFDAIRVGIQPFNADFRGFLFQDQPFGVRLFGNRDNNIHQYNLAWFRRLEKGTNSGLNDLGQPLRHDDSFIANYFWQDLFKPGFNSEFIALYNRNRESDHPFYNDNGFIERPASLGQERLRDYDVLYLGYNGEGRIDRFGLTLSAYTASGRESAGVFTGEHDQIRSVFVASELSYDDDWLRYRLHGIYASGDKNPYDNRATGYDAVFENPLIAGADTSYWIRQGVPLIAGGKVGLSSRNGVLNSLRSSKDHGQSNFTNPGLWLFGGGADADLTPQWRVSGNYSALWFDDTSSLEAARAQAPINRFIGHDVSVAGIYRPFMTQNIVLRFSVAALLPGAGFRDLYGGNTAYSVLANLVLTY